MEKCSSLRHFEALKIQITFPMGIAKLTFIATLTSSEEMNDRKNWLLNQNAVNILLHHIKSFMVSAWRRKQHNKFNNLIIYE